MVNTWSDAWFGEEGTRLIYLVPRAKTDELLPLTINPKPTEVVRVLVGRHDFLTPEQEAIADQQLKRLNAAQAELNAAQQADEARPLLVRGPATGGQAARSREHDRSTALSNNRRTVESSAEVSHPHSAAKRVLTGFTG